MDLEFCSLVGSFVAGVVLTAWVCRKVARQKWDNRFEGWDVGDYATIDTSESDDVDLVKHNGETLMVAGFTSDDRACFVVPSKVDVDDEPVGKRTFRVYHHNLIIPLKHLHPPRRPAERSTPMDKPDL